MSAFSPSLFARKATSSDFSIVERVLRRSNFLARTIEAFDKYDSRTAGFFGHAVELCNDVLNCASMSSAVAAVVRGALFSDTIF